MIPMRPSVSVMVLMMTLSAPVALSEEAVTADLGIDHSALPLSVDGFDDVRNGVFREGRVYIAGQPSEEALQRFQKLGVTVVINLRTPAEMENRERVPFDEAEVVRELGMEYVFIPLGGDDHPYTPEAVDEFASALQRHSGPVLLHCTVAWRASYMWVAYLISEQDFPLDVALARGEAIAISPPPLEGLLGKDLTYSYKE